MNKKFIFAGAIIILVGLMIFVSATKNTMEREGNGPYIIELDIYEGWNIIAGTIPQEGILSESEIQLLDIEVMWYYSPLQRKYLEVYPDTDYSALQQDDDDFVLTSAMWIYSNKAGKLKYSTLEDYPSLENRQLYSGWNFVTVTIDMFKGDYNPEYGNEGEYFSWEAVKGTCDYGKIYFWNPIEEKWMDMSPDLELKGYDFDDFMGYGMVVKVSDDCKLGTPSSGGVTPPPIPGNGECSDSDGGLDYYAKGTVTGQNEDDPIQQITTASDTCDGDTLYEFICKNSEEYDDESYICPNGCDDGACIQ